MPRFLSTYSLLALLAPLAGCQLISRDTLALPTASTANAPGTPSKVELPPGPAAEVCHATADALERAGKDAEAVSLYEKARQTGSTKSEIPRRLAVLYDRQGDFNKAAEEYKQLLQKNPKNADLLNDVGYSLYSQGKWTDAENYFRQAIAVNPQHARAWVNLGMTLAQTHRPADALDAFSKVVSPAQAHCNLAFILTAQKKFDEAKTAYRQALTLDPELQLARSALAKLDRPTPIAPRVAATGAVVEEELASTFVEIKGQ